MSSVFVPGTTMTAAQVISNLSQLHCSKSKGPIGFPLIFQREYKIKNDLPSFIALSLLYLTLKVVMIPVVTVNNLGAQTGSDPGNWLLPLPPATDIWTFL